ncbi:VWA domain-containing protein [Chloroflexota bacterium]
MSAKSSRQRASSRSVGVVLIVLVAGLFLMFGVCCGAYSLLSSLFNGEEPATPVPRTALTVAYSPEKEAVFRALVSKFNEQGFETPDGQPMAVEAVALDPESMVNAVLDGNATYQAMTPDSSVWLGQLDQAWREQAGSDAVAVGETMRFAVSPVVIAMWEELAREMGWPDRAISWQDLLTRAQQDPDFRWSHPSTNSASGLLATLAEFYAGAGKTRGLTIEDVTDQGTLDYVAALEKTVRYYGEGNEPAIIERALLEGRDFLDAFVVQEQMVTHFNINRSGQERLVALYPVEGALWEDHPLALLETMDLTPYHRQVFAQFRDFLLSPDAQQFILSYGYRPADLSIALDSPESPLTAGNGVDPTEPKTALQVPNASVIEVVRDVWWYTKRHTNVYLVADTSGSMRGEKLAQAQEALRIFLDQIKGDAERVGLIEFASGVDTVVPLDELGRNRVALEMAVDGMEAEGDTALLDAVYQAYQHLEDLGDTERINAVVVMTDGRENNSYISLRNLVQELRQDSRVPVVVFCIAYGDDADLRTLEIIAESTGGQVREGDPETIRDLYKILSTYF